MFFSVESNNTIEIDLFMRKLFIIFGAIGIIHLIYFYWSHIPHFVFNIVNDIFWFLGLILFLVSAIALISKAYFKKNWLYKTSIYFTLGGNLSETIEKFLNELPSPRKDTSSKLNSPRKGLGK